MNKVFISGRLTKDIEKKTSASGAEYVKFSVAVDKYAGKGKEKKTLFVDCMAFAHCANFLSKYCRKGSMVFIEGELDNNIVETDGRKTTYWTVIVSSVEANKPIASDAPSAPTPAPVETNNDMPFEM